MHDGGGNIDIAVRDADLTSTGANTSDVFGWHSRVRVGFHSRDNSDVNIGVQGGSITTKGVLSHGVDGLRQNSGDITIDVRGGTITTESTDIDRTYGSTFSHGINGDHRGSEGDIDIGVRGVRITTRGVNSYGIYSRHSNPTDADFNPLTDPDGNVIKGKGDITIVMMDGEISTEGDGSHGIYAGHDSGMGEISIVVGGGTVSADGENASGVRIGALNTQGEVVRAAGMGEDGYRRQTVTVNGRVMGGSGEGAGVWLAGGGKVVIGPKGSVGAASGVAIRAAGNPPKLHVSANLGARRIARVIDGEIRNDAGETTIVVNNVKLHDGATGATGLTAPNGARDVSVLAREGRLQFIEAYAPRAAVYERLPGFLLRLNGRGPAGERLGSVCGLRTRRCG